MKHLIDIESISKEDILNIIRQAKEYKNGSKESQAKDKTVALMFYENSTRTRCSFETAATKLSMNVINFDAGHSSLSKGESLKDTIENLHFIGVDAVVIRHPYSGIINNVMRLVNYPTIFINAGDGTHAHPTQALLDFYTMTEKVKSVENKKIVIVGDVAHSRVARSNIMLLSKFDADIHICSPSYLGFDSVYTKNISYHNNIKSAVKNADIVMALRVQNERHENNAYPSSKEYNRLYEINTELLREYASAGVILMHPGPANRNIEVSSEVLDTEQGKTILEQAQNGVFVRMAVLNILLKGACHAA